MAKAIGLLSGGLDSILACRLILDQGIEVIGFNFVTPFCTCIKGKQKQRNVEAKGCQYEARRAAEKLGIPLKVMAKTKEYIQMIKSPKHGYGSGMNPCIDCRIFILSCARDYMKEVGADFVFTGEVLGERPMSQHLQALKLIEQESGLSGRILRPLSAKLLEPTIPEKEGLVDRERLLGIQGRSRKPQIALAGEYGIKDYPCPAGGCLLTDKNFAQKLRDAFAHKEESLRDIQILKVGRHFRLPSGRKVVVGRNEFENRVLLNLTDAQDAVFEPVDVPGPVVVIFHAENLSEEELLLTAQLCTRYSDGKNLPSVKVKSGDREWRVSSLSEEKVRTMRC